MIPVAVFHDDPIEKAIERQDQAWTDQEENIFLSDHPAVITMGWDTGDNEVLGDAIPAIGVDRGGAVTLHAPGQIAAYVIIDLNKRGIAPGELSSILSLAAQRMLTEAGIYTDFDRDNPGLYTRDHAKISSVGVRCAQRFSSWGISVNVDNDLSLYQWIVPCGNQQQKMTNMREQGSDWSWQQAAETLGQHLQRVFEGPIIWRSET